MESSEVTSGITKLGDYELHDLVALEYVFIDFCVNIRDTTSLMSIGYSLPLLSVLCSIK